MAQDPDPTIRRPQGTLPDSERRERRSCIIMAMHIVGNYSLSVEPPLLCRIYWWVLAAALPAVGPANSGFKLPRPLAGTLVSALAGPGRLRA